MEDAKVLAALFGYLFTGEIVFMNLRPLRLVVKS